MISDNRTAFTIAKGAHGPFSSYSNPRPEILNPWPDQLLGISYLPQKSASCSKYENSSTGSRFFSSSKYNDKAKFKSLPLIISIFLASS